MLNDSTPPREVGHRKPDDPNPLCLTIAMNSNSQAYPAIVTPDTHCKVKPPNILQCTLSYRLTVGLKDDPNPLTNPLIVGMRRPQFIASKPRPHQSIGLHVSVKRIWRTRPQELPPARQLPEELTPAPHRNFISDHARLHCLS